jgi:hypothetical protein
MWLLPFALASAAWPACKTGSAAKAADGGRGVTVLYQNNANGEIEPCG